MRADSKPTEFFERGHSFQRHSSSRSAGRNSFFFREVSCEKHGRSHDWNVLITVTHVQNMIVSGNNHGGLEIYSTSEDLIVSWVGTDRRKVRNAINEGHDAMCD